MNQNFFTKKSNWHEYIMQVINFEMLQENISRNDSIFSCKVSEKNKLYEIFHKNVLLKIIFAAILLFFICLSCDIVNTPSLPDELLGSWSQNVVKGCTQTYTFRSHDYTFYEYCIYTRSTTYDEKIEEIFEDEDMFRTSDNTYMVWHFEGSILYLYKTNPNSTKPVLGSNWWSGYSAWTKK